MANDANNQLETRTVVSNQSNHSGISITQDNTYTRDLVLMIILAIFIIVINGLIAFSFVVERKLRHRPANIMICSQACTDLFTGIVFIPITCDSFVRVQTQQLLPFLNCYMLYLSLFNLLVISIDRYLALSKPFIHHKLIDVNCAIKLIVFVWVAPLAFIIIPLCWWFEPVAIKAKADRVYVCTIWTLMLALVVTMTLLYVLATKRAKRTISRRRFSCKDRAKAKDAMLARKELRVVHLFGLLLFFFVAAYLPILYINFVWLIFSEGYLKYAPKPVHDVGLYLLVLNSVVNPILCIMLKKDYLEAIKKILFKLPPDDLWSFTSAYGSRYGSRAAKDSTDMMRGSFRYYESYNDKRRNSSRSPSPRYKRRESFRTPSPRYKRRESLRTPSPRYKRRESLAKVSNDMMRESFKYYERYKRHDSPRTPSPCFKRRESTRIPSPRVGYKKADTATVRLTSEADNMKVIMEDENNGTYEGGKKVDVEVRLLTDSGVECNGV